MKHEVHIPSAVDFAYEVIRMHQENQRLKEENAELLYYREQYMKMLDQNIQHNEKMMAGVLELALTPGVMEACAAAKQKPVQF